MALDVRSDFPVTETVLTSPVTGKEMPLIYLDHGASTHPPRQVLDAHDRFLEQVYANVHRGAHKLSQVSTEVFEDARMKVQAFVGARPGAEVIFSTNTTGALNLGAHIMKDVEGPTLVTMLEHHSNDLPHRARGDVVHVECTDGGDLDMGDYEDKLRQHGPKLVALTAASNVTGIIPPIEECVTLAHDHGARVLLDGAQALAHLPLDLKSMGSDGGPDMFAAAGHKAYAPFGASFLVVDPDLADAADPFMPGGGTVKLVSTDEAMWTTGAERHEGGTPNIAGAVALAAGIDYLRRLGMENVRAHELELLRHVRKRIRDIDGLTTYGDVPDHRRVGVVSFNIDGVPHGLASTILDNEFGIATRNGCFCAHPYLVRLLGIGDEVGSMRQRLRDGGSTNEPDFPGAARATIGVYNTAEELDRFAEAVDIIARGEHTGEYSWSEAGGWTCKGCRVTDLPKDPLWVS